MNIQSDRARALFDRVIDKQLDEIEASLDGKVHEMAVNQLGQPMTLLEQALRLRQAL